jgi:hypothetical protein
MDRLTIDIHGGNITASQAIRIVQGEANSVRFSGVSGSGKELSIHQSFVKNVEGKVISRGLKYGALGSKVSNIFSCPNAIARCHGVANSAETEHPREFR